MKFQVQFNDYPVRPKLDSTTDFILLEHSRKPILLNFPYKLTCCFTVAIFIYLELILSMFSTHVQNLPLFAIFSKNNRHIIILKMILFFFFKNEILFIAY